ncbi:hypothetical protein LCGC14_1023140, partial [marine sediment metagenome]
MMGLQTFTSRAKDTDFDGATFSLPLDKITTKDIVTNLQDYATKKKIKREGAVISRDQVIAPTYQKAITVALAKGKQNLTIPDPRAKDVVPRSERIAMVQIDFKATRAETDQADPYFDKLYSKREGYNKSEDFWEIPTWISEGAATFPNSDVIIARDPKKLAEQLNEAGYKLVMFSAMDANKESIREIAKIYKGKIIVGGYVDKGYFKDLPNVEFRLSLQNAAKAEGIPYKRGVDNRHFKGTKTVPRLCSAKGCAHSCAFCTVGSNVEPLTQTNIDKQVETFKDLDFTLVYMDDKTFGQAPNYTYLEELYKKLKKQNPKFQGFIIQTTAPQYLKLDPEFLKKAGVKYVELGVESYNDDILRRLKKPANRKLIDKAVAKLREDGIAFIPNIMSGLAGKTKDGKIWTETTETYQNTLDFLKKNKDIISHVNIYNMAVYAGTSIGEQISEATETDVDENIISRSYLKDKKLHEGFYTKVLAFGSEMLDKTPVFKEVSDVKTKIEKGVPAAGADKLSPSTSHADVMVAMETRKIPEMKRVMQKALEDYDTKSKRTEVVVDSLSPSKMLPRLYKKYRDAGMTKAQARTKVQKVSGRYQTAFDEVSQGNFESEMVFAARKIPADLKRVMTGYVKTGNLAFGKLYDKHIAKHGSKLSLHATAHENPFVITYDAEKKAGIIQGPVSLLKAAGHKVVETDRVLKHPIRGESVIKEKRVTIDGVNFLIINAPILPRDPALRRKMINALVEKNLSALSWYKKWHDDMIKFEKAGMSREDIVKNIKIQAISTANRNVPSAATIAAGAVRDLEAGKEGNLGGMSEAATKKAREIWEGKETRVTMEDRISYYGRKIGAMVHSVLDESGESIVIDRHMGRLWGYNFTWTPQDVAGGFKVTTAASNEIISDIIQAREDLIGKHPGITNSDVQAALWYAAGVEIPRAGTSQITEFNHAILVDPVKRLGRKMLGLTAEEKGQKIVHFARENRFVIRGARAPRKLTSKDKRRMLALRDKSSSFITPLTGLEIKELTDLSTAAEGDKPHPWSRNDVLKRMESSTADNPYVQMSYWYSGKTRRETFFRGKVPNMTTVYENEVYDGDNDVLGYIGAGIQKALLDPRVLSGQLTLNQVKMNAIAGLIQNSQAYKGFTLPTPNGPIFFMFDEVKVETFTTEAMVALSDVVDVTKALPEDVEALEAVASQLLPDLVTDLRKRLSVYPVDIVETRPTLAKFDNYTSGQLEHGLSVTLKGPLPAVRAAMAELVGLSKKQNGVIILHTDANPNGIYVKMKVDPKFTSEQLHDKLTELGVKEYNRVVTSTGITLEHFIPLKGMTKETLEKAKAVLKGLQSVSVQGSETFTPMHAEVLGSWEGTEESRKNYKKHITAYE